MTRSAEPVTVYFVDFDNTLIDNDAALRSLQTASAHRVGRSAAAQFWRIYAEVARATTVVDVPMALLLFGETCGETASSRLRRLFFEFPFERFLYPSAPRVIHRLQAMGALLVVSDGEPDFQSHKIRRSGIAHLVNDRVFVFAHKEEQLDSLQRLFPADHYVVIDDKPRIHLAAKQRLGSRVTTVFVHQGHYARAASIDGLPGVDLVVATTADLLQVPQSALVAEHATPAPERLVPLPVRLRSSHPNR